jgi:hypothetical protein
MPRRVVVDAAMLVRMRRRWEIVAAAEGWGRRRRANFCAASFFLSPTRRYHARFESTAVRSYRTGTELVLTGRNDLRMCFAAAVESVASSPERFKNRSARHPKIQRDSFGRSGWVGHPPQENRSRLPLPIAWKPRRLRECGAMLRVVASVQAVIATEQLSGCSRRAGRAIKSQIRFKGFARANLRSICCSSSSSSCKRFLCCLY